MLRVIDALEEHDDVQNVYANFDIPDAVLAGGLRLGSAIRAACLLRTSRAGTHREGSTCRRHHGSTASETVQVEGYEGHIENFDGGYTVAFETYTAGRRPHAVLRGATRRPVPGRGLRLRDQGQGHVPLGDGRRDVRDRRRYSVGPGHTPVLYAGTEVVEFSPTEELQQTLEVVSKNMENV